MAFINNRVINCDEDGFAFPVLPTLKKDFKRAASVSQASSPACVLGEVNNISGEDGIVHNGLFFKRKNSLDFALPSVLDFTVPISQAVVDDLIELYGADLYNKEIVFLAQRTLLEPDEVYRPNFSTWHHHRRDSGVTNGSDVDLTYLFFDKIGTEFKDGENAVAAPKNSLIRFGGDVMHRSPRNTTSEPLWRTFGMYIVYNEHKVPRATRHYSGMGSNNALDDISERRIEFLAATEDLIKIRGSDIYRPYERPKPVIPGQEFLLEAAA